MSVDTYANLKTEINNHLDRSLSDADLDTLIDLAEARHKRDIRIRDMIVRLESSVSSRFISLPSDFLELQSFRLLTNPVTILEEVSRFEMSRIREEANDKPTRFAIHGDEIEFNVNPDDTYTSEMVYTKFLTALSDANTTNELLDRAPDTYLYGALLAAEPFLGNDPRIKIWADLYRSAVNTLNGVDRKRSGPLFARVVGDVP